MLYNVTYGNLNNYKQNIFLISLAYPAIQGNAKTKTKRKIFQEEQKMEKPEFDVLLQHSETFAIRLQTLVPYVTPEQIIRKPSERLLKNVMPMEEEK